MIDFDAIRERYVDRLLSNRWPDAARDEIASHGGQDHLYRFDGEHWHAIEGTSAQRAEWRAQQRIARAMEQLSTASRREVARRVIASHGAAARSRAAHRHLWLYGKLPRRPESKP